MQSWGLVIRALRFLLSLCSTDVEDSPATLGTVGTGTGDVGKGDWESLVKWARQG